MPIGVAAAGEDQRGAEASEPQRGALAADCFAATTAFDVSSAALLTTRPHELRRLWIQARRVPGSSVAAPPRWRLAQHRVVPGGEAVLREWPWSLPPAGPPPRPPPTPNHVVAASP